MLELESCQGVAEKCLYEGRRVFLGILQSLWGSSRDGQIKSETRSAASLQVLRDLRGEAQSR
jgi:hypothetical protein